MKFRDKKNDFNKEILLVRYQKMIENPFEKLTGDR